MLCLLLFPLLLALAMIRFIGRLWPVAIMGTLVYLVGIIGFIVFGAEAADAVRVEPARPTPAQLVLSFGTLIYSMESILLVLPNVGALRDQTKGKHVVLVRGPAGARRGGKGRGEGASLRCCTALLPLLPWRCCPLLALCLCVL